MASGIGWSQRALRDVEGIADYIAKDSPAYAAVFVRNIIAQTKMLSQFPRSGRKVPEFDDDGIRELLAYGYRIIYRIEQDRVIISAVIHGKRTLQ
ncbi:MAG TPA: type II toxin-antitoxin system RelE/ParE family toxin [Terriglobales bacterium]|jgi:plasmid stabilization system protein ParE|nr:type II toxin-antitoxin system RelE/ParE family toxin [Terriglobales bacterium]